MPGDVVVLQDRRDRRRVVVTFPLPSSAWAHLTATLGDRVDLVEVRTADGEEDAVVVLSTSRQLIAKIRTAFPRAVLIVVEVEDRDHGVDLGGQVMRSLDAGADGYYVARSLDRLAGVVEQALTSGSADPEPAALGPPVDDQMASILDRLIEGRAIAEPTTAAIHDREG